MFTDATMIISTGDFLHVVPNMGDVIIRDGGRYTVTEKRIGFTPSGLRNVVLLLDNVHGARTTAHHYC